MNTIKLMLFVSIVAALVAIGVSAQSVEPDRISFYNVPSQGNKYILHIDYADGREVREPQGACADGAVIEKVLNLYQTTFVTEGCTDDVFQHLNLRWLGGCLFDFENDPDVRIIARGAYGQVVVVGHYPQGIATLPIPSGTISMSAWMSYTIDSILRTGNVGFDFNEAIGCVDAPATETPTATPTEIVVVDDATPTPTEVVIICCPSTPVTFTPTPSPTELVTPTVTPGVSGQQPTGERPVEEPGRMVWLPVVSR